MYRRFLISDTKSSIKKEFQFVANMMREEFPPYIASFADDIEKMENHRIYRMPNGYGASVVKGFFTFDKLEVAEIRFFTEAPHRKMPKKKRRRKKWEKKYLRYQVMDNVIRVDTEDELKDILNQIESRS